MTFIKQNKDSRIFFKKHLNFFDLDFARKNASTLLKKRPRLLEMHSKSS